MRYEEMLECAYEKIPKVLKAKERFEPPKVDSYIQGNQTIIKNFGEIASKLRRPHRHLMKFLTKELAAPGHTDGVRALFQGKFTNRLIQAKLDLYIKEYVLCKVCGRPDTKLIKEDRIEIMKCEACGARSPVR